MKTKVLALIFALIALIAMFTGCGKKSLENVKANGEIGNSESIESVDFEEKSKDTFAIKTSDVTLYYPKKWKDTVKVKTSEKKVSFSNGEIKLFDICFSETDGALIGYYNETPISVVSYEFSEENMSKKEIQKNVEMQNDVNILIKNLTNDKNFVLAQ